MWNVQKETANHFHIEGDAGVFRIHKGSLSPKAIERFQALAGGGKVKKANGGKPLEKKAAGGKVDPDTGAIAGSPRDAWAKTTWKDGQGNEWALDTSTGEPFKVAGKQPQQEQGSQWAYDKKTGERFQVDRDSQTGEPFRVWQHGDAPKATQLPEEWAYGEPPAAPQLRATAKLTSPQNPSSAAAPPVSIRPDESITFDPSNPATVDTARALGFNPPPAAIEQARQPSPVDQRPQPVAQAASPAADDDGKPATMARGGRARPPLPRPVTKPVQHFDGGGTTLPDGGTPAPAQADADASGVPDLAPSGPMPVGVPITTIKPDGTITVQHTASKADLELIANAPKPGDTAPPPAHEAAFQNPANFGPAPAEAPSLGGAGGPPQQAAVPAPAQSQGQARAPAPQSPQGAPAPSLPGTGGYLSAAHREAEAAKATGAQKQAEANQEAGALEAANAKAQNYQAWVQEVHARESQHLDQLGRDLESQKVDPNNFWADKGTGDKIRLGASMILSGMGAGLTGQPNAAMGYIHQAIEHDLDAQRANIGIKEHVLGYYKDKYQNDDAAYQRAYADLLQVTANEVKAQAIRAGGGVQYQQGMQAAAQLEAEARLKAPQAEIQATEAQMSRLRLSVMQKIYGGDLSSMDPREIRMAQMLGLVDAVPIDRQGNIGVARSKQDAEAVNKELPEWHAAQDTLDRMDQVRQQHGTKVAIPGTDAHREYAGLQFQLGNAIEKATAGRVNESTLEGQIRGMGGTWATLYAEDPLKATREWVNTQHRNLVNQHTWSREGGDVSSSEAPRGQAAGQRFTDPRYPGMVFDATGKRVQ